MTILRYCLPIVLGATTAYAQQQQPSGNTELSPTFEDQQYGEHAQDFLDLWIADSDGPTPLVIVFHGALLADKSNIRTNPNLVPLLEAGISVAAVRTKRNPGEDFESLYVHADEALDYLVAMADEWGIDANNIGTFGTSQGAGIAMWLGFRDADSVGSRSDQASRIRAVGNIDGQTTLDESLWREWIPAFTPEDIAQVANFYGGSELLADTSEAARVINELSAISNISSDDPPLWMSYQNAPGQPLPDGPLRIYTLVHHVNFGLRLKERADDLGNESYLNYPGRQSMYPDVASFLIGKLAAE